MVSNFSAALIQGYTTSHEQLFVLYHYITHLKKNFFFSQSNAFVLINRQNRENLIMAILWNRQLENAT